MNGRMRSFKLNKKYWDTPEPITPDKLPAIKINLLALSKYAEEKGKKTFRSYFGRKENVYQLTNLYYKEMALGCLFFFEFLCLNFFIFPMKL